MDLKSSNKASCQLWGRQASLTLLPGRLPWKLTCPPHTPAPPEPRRETEPWAWTRPCRRVRETHLQGQHSPIAQRSKPRLRTPAGCSQLWQQCPLPVTAHPAHDGGGLPSSCSFGPWAPQLLVFLSSLPPTPPGTATSTLRFLCGHDGAHGQDEAGGCPGREGHGPRPPGHLVSCTAAPALDWATPPGCHPVVTSAPVARGTRCPALAS